MKLSSPIYSLKRRAKSIARELRIPLHEAQNQLARQEGYATWSLLAAKAAERSTAKALYDSLAPGELVLIGARPGQGKTLLSLEIAAEAVRNGNPAYFFSLEYSEREFRTRLSALGIPPDLAGFRFDGSDDICASYIIEALIRQPAGTLAVIDYLQLLDQKRTSPELADQIAALRAFARSNGVVLVFISQIDRAYDPGVKLWPDLGDVRLPNRVDLRLFDKACFLQDGKLQVS